MDIYTYNKGMDTWLCSAKPNHGAGNGRGQMRNRVFAVAAIALSALLFPTSARAFDFTPWDKILKQNTRRATFSGVGYTGFDYSGVMKSEEFDRLLSDIESFSPDRLNGGDETLAFWINTYNIFAVSLVRKHFPVNGIKDTGTVFSSVWKLPAGKVGGKPYSLNDIEHAILRPLNEPAVHFAIVCASVSCPDLRPEAYRASALREQLKSQLAEFLENPRKGMRIEPAEKKVYLSKIFGWYEKDFREGGGIIPYLNRARDGSKKIPPGFSIEYLPYRWELNTVR